MAVKYLMFKSIIFSQQNIPKNNSFEIQDTVIVPDMSVLKKKSLEEIRALKITEVQWNVYSTFEIILNDGQ